MTSLRDLVGVVLWLSGLVIIVYSLFNGGITLTMFQILQQNWGGFLVGAVLIVVAQVSSTLSPKNIIPTNEPSVNEK